MPNEDVEVGKLEALEKYRSFRRYFRRAERESREPRWWNTYRKHCHPPAGTRHLGIVPTPPREEERARLFPMCEFAERLQGKGEAGTKG